MRSSARRTIFIGDVHGCASELESLLARCEASPSDRIVFLGDLVAKGPDSHSVVALAREWRALCVRGNHEQAILGHHRALVQGTPLPELKSSHQRVVRQLTEDDWRYLETLPFYLQFPDLHMVAVHAGIVPGRPLPEQRDEDLLTMRALRADGTATARLEQGRLWGLTYRGPEHVVFGHNAITGLQRHPFATGLDTGCVYGRALTALVMPESRLVSVSARRAYKEFDG